MILSQITMGTTPTSIYIYTGYLSTFIDPSFSLNAANFYMSTTQPILYFVGKYKYSLFGGFSASAYSAGYLMAMKTKPSNYTLTCSSSILTIAYGTTDYSTASAATVNKIDSPSSFIVPGSAYTFTLVANATVTNTSTTGLSYINCALSGLGTYSQGAVTYDYG